MAEPIGIASGLLALASFAFQSSVSLYQVIGSFQSNKRFIRELKQELEALDGVLQSLQQATVNSIIDVPALRLPLLRCGQACQEFETLIVKCTAHSGGSRTSFRDWAKLTYMGDDIIGFKNMLAGYKATISIALGDANFRTAAVTADVLKQYKEMISSTQSDLEDHLQEIENKLQALPLRGDVISDEDAAEREQIQKEKDSTRQCLVICAQVSKQVNQLRPNLFEDVSAVRGSRQIDISGLGGFVSAKRFTANVLQGFHDKLVNATSDLEEHFHNIDQRIRTLSSPDARDLVEIDRKRAQEEVDSIRECLTICAEASKEADQFRTNVFEDVAAAKESHQVIVATLGDLVSAKRVNTEPEAKQWLGQMSDASLQQLSRDHAIQLPDQAVMDMDVQPRSELGLRFAGQYGAGYRLS